MDNNSNNNTNVPASSGVTYVRVPCSPMYLNSESHLDDEYEDIGQNCRGGVSRRNLHSSSGEEENSIGDKEASSNEDTDSLDESEGSLDEDEGSLDEENQSLDNDKGSLDQDDKRPSSDDTDSSYDCFQNLVPLKSSGIDIPLVFDSDSDDLQKKLVARKNGKVKSMQKCEDSESEVEETQPQEEAKEVCDTSLAEELNIQQDDIFPKSEYKYDEFGVLPANDLNPSSETKVEEEMTFTDSESEGEAPTVKYTVFKTQDDSEELENMSFTDSKPEDANPRNSDATRAYTSDASDVSEEAKSTESSGAEDDNPPKSGDTDSSYSSDGHDMSKEMEMDSDSESEDEQPTVEDPVKPASYVMAEEISVKQNDEETAQDQLLATNGAEKSASEDLAIEELTFTDSESDGEN